MLRDVMAKRLQASSPEDYFVKLLARRTSRNGVFGMKAHFHHFEPALAWCPSMLERLSPVTYIVPQSPGQAGPGGVDGEGDADQRLDVDGQRRRDAPRYDEGLIRRCLEEIERQRLGWLRWFEINAITPVVVSFEDLIADRAGVVRGVVELLRVEGDEPERFVPPPSGNRATKSTSHGRPASGASTACRPRPRSTDPRERGPLTAGARRCCNAAAGDDQASTNNGAAPLTADRSSRHPRRGSGPASRGRRFRHQLVVDQAARAKRRWAWRTIARLDAIRISPEFSAATEPPGANGRQVEEIVVEDRSARSSQICWIARPARSPVPTLARGSGLGEGGRG